MIDADPPFRTPSAKRRARPLAAVCRDPRRVCCGTPIRRPTAASSLRAAGHEAFRIAMKASPPDPADKKRRRPSNLALNLFAVLVGLVTFGLGAAWVIYSWIVDREAPYFAIPLVFSVPVIVAVAVRSIWE